MTMIDTLDHDEADPGADGTGDIRQFVSFFLDEERFGFPIETVQEIIRMPKTVGVPMSPRVLVGLANLRGQVLPVLDLRAALGLPEGAHNDATRVIVVDAGQRIGLIVDRVARVQNIETSLIEEASAGAETMSETITGVARQKDGSMLQLIDARAIVCGQFPGQAEGLARTQAHALAAAPEQAEVADDDASDMAQLVSLMLDGEEYAFPIEQVDEIVRVPEQIAQVPQSSARMLGLITLRDRLLPVVSLRRIFGAPDAARSDSNRIVVLNGISDSAFNERVGVVVDQVREVLRVPLAARDQLPGVFRRGERHEIDSVCQLDEGRRLVSILSPSALFDQPSLRAALQAETAATATQAETTQREETDAMDEGLSDEIQLVVYQLAAQEFCVEIQDVQEIIRVPETLARVPKAPSFVEGIINLRGSVLPVVELRRKLGLTELDRNDRQRILVLQVDGSRTGFIVDSVTEVLRVPATALDAAPRLHDESSDLIRQVAKLDHGNRMLLVTSARTLIDGDDLSNLKLPEPTDL